MNISIIGAGPGGSFAAKLLAEKGHDVTIYEDHPCVGIPVQCTGLVTKTFLDLHPIKKEFLVNEMHKVRVNAPNGTNVDIPLTEYVLDRAKLDQTLCNEAINAGAQLKIHHRFVGAKDDKIMIKHKGETIEKKTDIIIGADGPNSDVAKNTGIYGNRPMFIAHQVTIKGNFNQETFTTYFGKWAPGFFAWVVPENENTARVGLATNHDTKTYFEKFIKQIPGKIVDVQAGPIPWYTGNETVEKDGRVFLVGDAAGLAKATTGGGIITAMTSAKILTECIETGANYTKSLTSLRRMLWLHNTIRKVLNNFSDEDYNKLIKLMNKESVKKVLNTHTREHPFMILANILFREPRFLGFAHKLFV
ncbi:NAD(P)/FAD-dependent oxidoreductase [Candidatus Woesearchaeota archaeon]|nr:NAD(P)/FAD-dependent oxidoreductase [Candidatus Woesearchaeota archaeon]